MRIIERKFIDEETGEEFLEFCVVAGADIIECFDTLKKAEEKLEALEVPKDPPRPSFP